MSKTDPMWVFENYGEAAELIDEHEAVIAQQATRIAELEKFADEANAQMLEAFAERDHALKAQQLSTGCDTCHGQGEIYSGEDQHFGYMSMQPPEPIMITCPECSGESVKPSAGVVLPTVEQITEALDDVTCFHDLSAELIAPALLENLRAMIGSTHAGSGVVLPERMPAVHLAKTVRQREQAARALGWNLALNEVARLNPCRAQSVPDGIHDQHRKAMKLLREVRSWIVPKGNISMSIIERVGAFLDSAAAPSSKKES